MKIENMGVKITAGSGSIYHEIVITPEDGIYVNGASWSRAETVDVAHALSTAVEKYDALTRTQEQPAPDAPAFTVGQVLTGDEDLPVGTLVNDKDGDPWDITVDLPLKDIRKHWAPFTIVSLP